MGIASLIVIAAAGVLPLVTPLVAQPSLGQPTADSSQTAAGAESGSELTVYLLTMGRGDAIWEKFGHNAIWIHNAAARTEVAYHWGLFDFADKDFFSNFARGRMRYAMGSFDATQTIDFYRRANRTVWAQELNLSPAQRRRLADLLIWNDRPENRYYAYDYYRDNCSTRVRDAIDSVIDGAIHGASSNVATRTTYRSHTARLTQDEWPVFTGMMLGLGQLADRPISAWDEMFLPVRMMSLLRGVRVSTDGVSVPLVRSERVLFQSTRTPEPVDLARGISGYLLIAALILVLGGLIWRLQVRRGGSILAVLGLATVWSLVAGTLAVGLLMLWGFTEHAFSYRNENILQANPLSLVLAVLLVRLMWTSRRGGNAARVRQRAALAAWIATTIAVLSILGFLMQASGAFDQANGMTIALMLPLNVGVAVLLRDLSGRQPGSLTTP